MPAITLVDGDIYLTTAPSSAITDSQINDGSYVTVRIVPSTFENIIDNKPIIIPIAKSRQTQPSTKFGTLPTFDEVNGPSSQDGAVVTKIRDIQNITHTFNIQGVLIYETGDTAFTKMKNLEILNKYGGTINMIWRTGSNQRVVEGIITKSSVKVGRGGMTTSQNDGSALDTENEWSYDVQVGFTKGTNR